MFHKTLLIALALLTTSACSPVSAEPLVDVSVMDRDTGQWLPEYTHRGDTWVAGTPGDRYSVRLTNTSGARVLVVLSVDGINAVTGETANPGQAGYVLEPWESAEIAGWRKSLNDVAQFVFTDLGDSYAARTGRPRNVGVIGIAAFRESAPRYYPQPVPSLSRAQENATRDYEQHADKAAAPAANSSMRRSEAAADGMARQSIGTGHGQREWSPVGQTDFIRASSQPGQISQLRYDDSQRLLAMGIIPRDYDEGAYPRGHARPEAPRAFPQGFVADPPYQ